MYPMVLSVTSILTLLQVTVSWVMVYIRRYGHPMLRLCVAPTLL